MGLFGKKNPFKKAGNFFNKVAKEATEPLKAITNSLNFNDKLTNIGKKGSNLAERAGRNSLLKTIEADQTIDTQSKGEFLDLLMKGTKTSVVGGEYQKAVEGIDPKYKSRKNVEEYYKAIVDKPGARQTRSPDMLLSNAFNGVGR